MVSEVATPHSAIAVGISFPIIDAILVGLRFYTRRHFKAKIELDDWLCIPAWLCMTGCCVSMMIGVFGGAFEEAPLTGPDHVTAQERLLAQTTAALVILWMGANFLIKLIMLFFYRRIFNVMGRWFNICNWVFIWLSIVWFIYAVISWLFYCGLNFKENFEGGWLVCPRWGFEIQMGVFALDSFIDLGLLIMPIPFVWRLKLDFKRKIAITIVFLLGGFAFVAGFNNTIIQLVYLTNPDIASSEGGANFFQGSSLLFSNWPAIEIGVGLLASNLPHLSFRIAHALKESMPRAVRVSLSSLRHALSLSSLRGHRSTQPPSPPTREGERPGSQPGSREDLWRVKTPRRRWDEISTFNSQDQSSGVSAEIVQLGGAKLSRSPTGEQAV